MVDDYETNLGPEQQRQQQPTPGEFTRNVETEEEDFLAMSGVVEDMFSFERSERKKVKKCEERTRRAGKSLIPRVTARSEVSSH